MLILALACAFFIFVHLIVSGTNLRAQITDRIGRPAYLLLYVMSATISVIWMTIAFMRAQLDMLNITFWETPGILRILALPVNLLAFMLVVIGVTSSSPTGLSSRRQLPHMPIYGIIRVTRHPILAGIGVWALMHMITSPQLASWVFFGTLLVSSAAGASIIDRKRLIAYDSIYGTIMRRTSIIPFAAIIQGRVDFNVREIGFAKPFMALGIFCLIAVLHEFLFSVRAL